PYRQPQRGESRGGGRLGLPAPASARQTLPDAPLPRPVVAAAGTHGGRPPRRDGPGPRRGRGPRAGVPDGRLRRGRGGRPPPPPAARPGGEGGGRAPFGAVARGRPLGGAVGGRSSGRPPRSPLEGSGRATPRSSRRRPGCDGDGPAPGSLARGRRGGRRRHGRPPRRQGRRSLPRPPPLFRGGARGARSRHHLTLLLAAAQRRPGPGKARPRGSDRSGGGGPPRSSPRAVVPHPHECRPAPGLHGGRRPSGAAGPRGGPPRRACPRHLHPPPGHRRDHRLARGLKHTSGAATGGVAAKGLLPTTPRGQGGRSPPTTSPGAVLAGFACPPGGAITPPGICCGKPARQNLRLDGATTALEGRMDRRPPTAVVLESASGRVWRYSTCGSISSSRFSFP